MAKRCIQSWKRYCPSFEIIEWNETNFNVNSCAYVREAYQAKKWAFVSDYARFKILYENGGLYFDTDVELIKPIDDIIENGPFMGCEAGSEIVAPGLGLGGKPGLGLYKEILDFYESSHFGEGNREKITKTVVQITTDILKKHGFKGTGQIEEVEGVMIYPVDFFCPMNYWTGEITITENTRSIHHYNMTWKSRYDIVMKKIERPINRLFGRKIGSVVFRIATLPIRVIHRAYVVFFDSL